MSAKDAPGNDQDNQVEMWKVKKLIKSLQAARGSDIFNFLLFAFVYFICLFYIIEISNFIFLLSL